MNQAIKQIEFLASVQDYSIMLLDAPTPEARVAIVDEIADDSALSAAVLMLLAEHICPLLPEPQEGLRQ